MVLFSFYILDWFYFIEVSRCSTCFRSRRYLSSEMAARGANRMRTAIAVGSGAALLFSLPAAIHFSSAGPKISADKPLKSEAIRRGAFNNSGSTDIGPEYVPVLISLTRRVRCLTRQTLTCLFLICVVRSGSTASLTGRAKRRAKSRGLLNVNALTNRPDWMALVDCLKGVEFIAICPFKPDLCKSEAGVQGKEGPPFSWVYSK